MAKQQSGCLPIAAILGIMSSNEIFTTPGPGMPSLESLGITPA